MFKRINIAVLLIAIFGFGSTALATDVSGAIDTNTIWDLAGSPYTLVGDFQINESVTLTVEDGVIVDNPGGYLTTIYGTIQAQATISSPVVFNNMKITVASAGTVILDYAEFNEGHLRNNLGFEHFTITNCRFNETSYLRINARTDSYFDRNTLTDAGYVELIANTSSHDRDVYARWNNFYGKHATLALKSCFKVSYEGSDRLVIHSNNFLDENNYGISLHFNTTTVDATNNYWGTTDPAVIATRINDSNDNPSILGTVVFDPFATKAFHKNAGKVNLIPCIAMLLLQEDGTKVSGEIDTNTVWDLAGSPYTLVDDLQLNNGITLTIEEGVIVNNPNNYPTTVYGIVNAQATADNPVIFNSFKLNVASAGTVILDYVEFNGGHIQNNLGFEHFTITNCRFNATGALRINARTDSYFDRNTLTNAGYVELVAYTSNHDRDLYARWNNFYGSHPTVVLKSCFKVSYPGSDRLVIHSNNFLDDNDYGISLHTNTTDLDATNNYWGTTDPTEIAARINDFNDNGSIPGTVIFDPFATTPISPE